MGRTQKNINHELEQENCEIGQRIAKLRTDYGETQTDLAKLLGLSDRKYVTEFETGLRTIKAKYIKEIAKHYKVSSDYLLGLTEVISPNTETQAICKDLGLSERAIDNIRYYSNSYLNEVSNQLENGSFDYENISDKNKELFENYSWDINPENIRKALNIFFSCDSFTDFAFNLGVLYETSINRKIEEEKFKTDKFSPDEFNKRDILFKCAKLELQESFEQVRNELLEEVEKSVSGGKENAKHKKSK